MTTETMLNKLLNVSADLNGRSVTIDTPLTLRDFFAAFALMGMMAIMAERQEDLVDPARYRSQWAYEYADAMLAERKKQP